MSKLIVRELQTEELLRLTALFDYNDVPAMIAENARLIESGSFSIYLLLEDEDLIGELHVTWRSDDPVATGPGRAYLSAFRIREERQGSGLGQHLLQSVMAEAAQRGFPELTIGVEDDNHRALHIYRKLGFTHFLERRRESYQGDEYEYSLYLKQA